MPKTRPSTNELLNILFATSASYARIFVIIDGLDECQSEGGHRVSLLSHLYNFQVERLVNLFYTSRAIHGIEEAIGYSIKQEIKATESDVSKFIDGQLSETLQHVPATQGLKAVVKSRMMKLVDGM